MYENKKYIVHEDNTVRNLHLLMLKSVISFVQITAYNNLFNVFISSNS